MKKVIFFILLSLHLLATTNNTQNHISPQVLFIKAMQLADRGYSKEALKKINLLLKINPTNPEYLLLKGSILKDLKHYEEAKIILKQVLKLKPDDKKTRKLLEDIKEIENMAENDVVKIAFDWLSDKGIDLLFMFLGVLGGELLIGAFSECKKEQKKQISTFVNKVLKKASIKENFACYIINGLIIVTLALVFTIVVLFLILLINLPVFHLNTITKDEFWIFVISIYLIILIIIAIIFILKTKRTKVNIDDVALILMKYYENKEYDVLKEELLEISRLPQEYIDGIFKNIVFKDMRGQIKLFYEFVTKADK